jgi:hypothetical protein
MTLLKHRGTEFTETEAIGVFSVTSVSLWFILR